MRRPGVATKRSAPDFTCCACACLDAPPCTATTRQPPAPPYLRPSACTWSASSRVGTRMRQ
eukprot:2770757-Prymnesium_polylepis.1